MGRGEYVGIPAENGYRVERANRSAACHHVQGLVAKIRVD
jgi:hypothetical protein